MFEIPSYRKTKVDKGTGELTSKILQAVADHVESTKQTTVRSLLQALTLAAAHLVVINVPKDRRQAREALFDELESNLRFSVRLMDEAEAKPKQEK
ncbi:MAG: hypothetical protein EOP64_00110 [Sphingomonas sp.]|nr:MAG: hypothetical protein EOP64_00110 [Sphingomonas sp.]